MDNVKRYAADVLVGIVVLCTFGCSTLRSTLPVGRGARKHKAFVIARSDKAEGWGVLSHPRLISLSTNTIILQYYVGGDDPDDWAKAKKSVRDLPPAVSFDGGKSWQFEGKGLSGVVAKHAHYWGYDIRGERGTILGIGNTAIRVDGEGTLVEGPWTTSFQTTRFSNGKPWHRRIRHLDGTLYSSTYADVVPKKPGDGKKRDRRQIHLTKSVDQGRSWSVVSKVADETNCDWGTEGPNESTLEVLPDGTIICIMRTGNPSGMSMYHAVAQGIMAPLLQATSTDGGETWSYKKLSMVGVYPRLLRMSNGALVLSTGRLGNVLYFSRDGGESWGGETFITQPTLHSSGYCDIAEVGENRLLVVYDMFNTDTSGIWLWEPKPVNAVYGCFVDVYP